MVRIDDDEPAPRNVLRDLERWHPTKIATSALRVGEPLEKSFLDVIDDRRSIRRLRPPSIERLATLLWHGARTRETGTRPDGLPWQHRASPSAGGLHPIELFILPSIEGSLLRYDSIVHALDLVGEVDSAQLEHGRSRLRSVLEEAQGTYLILVADVTRTEAVYEHAESLVWRDAGALLATLQLTATAMGLGFCLIGLLGSEVVASLSGPPTLRAVGAAVVGEY